MTRLFLLSVALALAASTAYADEITFDTSTIFAANGLRQDATTGDNTDRGAGWYVDAGADEHTNDFIRERPLGTNEFQNGGLNPGMYFAFIDIKSAEFGSNDQYMAFRFTMFGNYSQNDPDASKNVDASKFAESTYYRIILNTRTDGDSEGSLLLSIFGDEEDVYKSDASGTFDSKHAQAWWDSDGTVVRSSVPDENIGSSNNGYDKIMVDGDGELKDQAGAPTVLWSRIINGAMPTIELLFDYRTYNANNGGAANFLPDDLTLLVFESNKGTQDVGNYLWHDLYSTADEGNAYDDGQGFQNVYELDRLLWSFAPATTPVPEPGTLALLAMGLLACAAIRIRRRATRV